MTVSLLEKKRLNVLKLCDIGLTTSPLTIRFVLHIIGTLNLYCVAIDYGGNHFKRLEIDQIQVLKRNHDNFDSLMTISEEGRHDLLWWKQNVNLVL